MKSHSHILRYSKSQESAVSSQDKVMPGCAIRAAPGSPLGKYRGTLRKTSGSPAEALGYFHKLAL